MSKGKHLTGKAKDSSVTSSAEEQLKVDLQCCANAEENEREVICPVRIALHQSRPQMPVKSFYETVCDWVTSCCVKTLTA